MVCSTHVVFQLYMNMHCYIELSDLSHQRSTLILGLILLLECFVSLSEAKASSFICSFETLAASVDYVKAHVHICMHMYKLFLLQPKKEA